MRCVTLLKSAEKSNLLRLPPDMFGSSYSVHSYRLSFSSSLFHEMFLKKIAAVFSNLGFSGAKGGNTVGGHYSLGI